MIDRTLRIAAVALLSVFAGCIEIESMEITVVADQANDRLDFMIVSRGIWSKDNIKGAAELDEKDLRYDLEQILKCRDVSALPIPPLGVADFTDKPDDPDAVDWQQGIRHLDIEPGAFFLDEQGRLSFYQFMRVNGLAAMIEMSKKEAHAEWRRQVKDKGRSHRECVEAAIVADLSPVAVDGAGFVYYMPMSADDHEESMIWLCRRLVRQVEAALEGKDGMVRSDATQRGLVQLLRDNKVGVVRREGVTEVYIGVQGSERCDYQIRGGAYQDNLLKEFQKLEPPPPKVSQAMVDRQFEAFRKREARLPKAYAQARARAIDGDKKQ